MKKVKKDIKKYVESGMLLGAGSVAVQGVGGSPAPLGTMGKMMGPMATATMGGHTIRMVKKLSPKRKRRRKKYNG